MHQTVGNVLRTLLHGHLVPGNQNTQAIIENALATTMHALRTNVSRALNNHSPGELVFDRHMFLNLPLQADFHALHQRRQELVQKNLLFANQRCVRHDFQPGQRILVKEFSTKLGQRTEGPFLVQRVHTNGTITIQRTPTITERINTRRVFPYS
jgi:hypothetical protein